MQQRYLPVSVSVPKPAPVAPVTNQNKPAEPQAERTVSILPSLKSSLDANTFSTLQIK